MGKCQNLKIHPNYKILGMILFLGLFGCKKNEHEHKNIITGIATIGNNHVLFFSDIETGKERIFKYYSDFYEYPCHVLIRLDDTVTITAGDEVYQKLILDQHCVDVILNQDILEARKQCQTSRMKQQIDFNNQK